MSQDDIIKVLEKKKEPLTSKELAEYINIRSDTIRKTLRTLLKHNEIKARKITEQEKHDKGYDNLKCINNRTRVFFLEDE